MEFLDKEYTFDSEENFDEFLKAVGIPEEHIEKVMEYKPTTKLVQDGDDFTYIATTPEGTKETKFQSGEEVEHDLAGVPIKSTYTVDGNTVTQVVGSDKGTATIVREYSEDELKVTITSTLWEDGVAYRYYKA